MFDTLMNAAEAYTKYIAAGMVALLRSVDPALAYRHEYELARTSGPGRWADLVADLATSPSVVHAANREDCFSALQELTERAQPGMWQREIVEAGLRAYAVAAHEQVKLDRRMKLIDFFTTFVEIRNKDAHGALLAHQKDEIGAHLSLAMSQIVQAEIFQLPCFAVVRDTTDRKIIRAVTREAPARDDSPDDLGMYFGQVEPTATPLVRLDVGGRDLLFANGERDTEIEYLSYSTGNRVRQANPVGDLPTDRLRSETAALRAVQFGRAAMTTAPSLARSGYVERPVLQENLINELVDERRLIITLRGMGGAGKTSLALWANQELIKSGPFEFIFWLSARDIDLSASGASSVEPDVRSLADVAFQVARVLEWDIEGNAIDWLAARLSDQLLGRSLWIFDNFETFEDPERVYSFIYEHVDRPHCALITSRLRNYTGDVTIEVGGMVWAEFSALVNRESDRLGIRLVTAQARRLYDETLGNPYLARLMLGEMKYGRETKIERILASQDGLLVALFERTFAKLSDAARLAFLGLCEVNSLVLEAALELGLVRVLTDRAGASRAIREVLDFSLAVAIPAGDGDIFLEVPMSAREYGRRHVRTDARPTEIAELHDFLALFSTTKRTDLPHGGVRAVEGLVSSLRRELIMGAAPSERIISLISTVGDR
jgi:hypothetical protein